MVQKPIAISMIAAAVIAGFLILAILPVISLTNHLYAQSAPPRPSGTCPPHYHQTPTIVNGKLVKNCVPDNDNGGSGGPGPPSPSGY